MITVPRGLIQPSANQDIIMFEPLTSIDSNRYPKRYLDHSYISESKFIRPDMLVSKSY